VNLGTLWIPARHASRDYGHTITKTQPAEKFMELASLKWSSPKVIPAFTGGSYSSSEVANQPHYGQP
jgi:hypothetical protein